MKKNLDQQNVGPSLQMSTLFLLVPTSMSKPDPNSIPKQNGVEGSRSRKGSQSSPCFTSSNTHHQQ
jgi:hypothetical protein